jgi:ABC-2 type transport system permease protein
MFAAEPAMPWRLSFVGLLAAEVRKITSLASTWVLIGLSLVLGLITTATTVSAMTAVESVLPVDVGGPFSNGHNVTQAFIAGPVFPGLMMALLGILSIVNEYSSGMIRTTLALTPARWPALLAKTVVVAVAAFVTTFVGEFIGALIAYAQFGAGASFDLFTADGLQVWFGTSFVVVVLALLGLAVGVMVRSTGGAVMIDLFGLMMVGPFLVMAVGQTDAAATVALHFPTLAAYFVYLGPIIGRHYIDPADGMLTATSATVTMLLWAVVALAGAFAVFQRRDA